MSSSIWGHEFMWPNEESHEWCKGWLSRLSFPDAEKAVAFAAHELDIDRKRLTLTPVLMREESEVEAKIVGHEAPGWVECTKRARRSEPFWRVMTETSEACDALARPASEVKEEKNTPSSSSSGGF